MADGFLQKMAHGLLGDITEVLRDPLQPSKSGAEEDLGEGRVLSAFTWWEREKILSVSSSTPTSFRRPC